MALDTEGHAEPGRFVPITWHGRSEGIASSFFEGIRSPVAEVAVAIANVGGSDAAISVAENVAALAQATEQKDEEFSLAMLHEWQRILMAHATYLPREMIGAFRNQQGWIGGSVRLTQP